MSSLLVTQQVPFKDWNLVRDTWAPSLFGGSVSGLEQYRTPLVHATFFCEEGATTTHDMAAILVRPLSLRTKLLLLLLVFIMTAAVSSARPHPPSLAIEEALKSATSSAAAAAKEPKALHVLATKRVPHSGPSNKGHSAPTSKRHLLHLLAGNDRVGGE
ncbi:hypothetical protein BHM03_00036015 [Ensete ventricosum]|nr:hypothetical protein BHM03_00036015 [Ensete ventricosum]